MQPLKKTLNILVDRDLVHKILAVGHEFDVNRNGLYDARSGCVNVWCSPTDKPECWDIPVSQGCLKFPREYVGGIYWEWNEPSDKFSIYIETTPYDLERKYKKVSQEQMESCLKWVEMQTRSLLRLAHVQETILGTCCPLCDFVLPNGRLLNELIDHIVEAHQDVKLGGLTLGNPSSVSLNGVWTELKNKTDMN